MGSRSRQSKTKAAIGIGVLALTILILAWKPIVSLLLSVPEPLSQTTSSPTNSPATARPIRVGVILSHASAIDPGWVGRAPQYGYTTKVLRMGLGEESDIQLYPVIEPGTAELGEMPKVLEQYFAGRAPIDCTDTASMAQIDVFLASGIFHLTPDLLAGLNRAVRDDGKGLLIRAWLGVHTPGATPEVLAINGMREGAFRMAPNNRTATAKRSHPILADVLPVGAALQMEPNGLAGFHNGPTLIEFASTDLMPPLTTQPADAETYVHSPLYTATFGKGKIVGCCWLGHAGDGATKDTLRLLTIRSIRWLADRLLE